MPAERSALVTRRLRPLRLAFLVAPGSRERLLDVIRVNTCLWGGLFNPVIPHFRRRPERWLRDDPARPSAREILTGYIHAFDVDVIVADRETDDARELAAQQDIKSVTYEDILRNAANDPVDWGINVVELYRHLYEQEFRFERANRPRVVLPTANSSPLRLLVPAVFGDFPSEHPYQFHEAFVRYFSPVMPEVQPSNFFRLLRGSISPLLMGSEGIDTLPRWKIPRPTLFLMDAANPVDLIDYWNLRAAGRPVVPVPKQWKEGLRSGCEEYIASRHRPLPFSANVMQTTTLLKARSIDIEEAKSFTDSLNVPENSLSFQAWYPRIWDDLGRDYDDIEPVALRADESEVEVAVSRRAIAFKDVSPPFATSTGRLGPGWANVVQIRELEESSDSAPVIPLGLRNLGELFGGFGPFRVRTSREGLVVTSDWQGWTHRWTLPTGLEVLRAWFASHGVEINLSGAGRVAHQMIESFGSVRTALTVCNRRILEELSRMGRGRTSHRGRWQTLLTDVHEGNERDASHHLSLLLEHRVMELGIQLRCFLCQHTNWVELNRIAKSIECERCLRIFAFPAADPPANAWFYRAVGPFSVGDFGQGAYCVVAALGFLGRVGFGEQTWIPSFELRGADGRQLEADFASFWRRYRVRDSQPQLVFGECKSTRPFLETDMRRLRDIGRKFRGAVLAVCTFRESFDRQEKARLADLIRRGAATNRRDGLYEVVLLTGVELRSGEGPPACWRGLGGKFDVAASEVRGIWSLDQLSRITQELHVE